MQQVKASFENYAEGLWVHFSKLPQLTINPKQFHQDPAGLYLFPDKFKTEGNWHRFPFKIVCRLKPGLRVLDVPKLTHAEIMDLLDAFGFQDMKDDQYLVPGESERGFQDRFWDIIRQRFMGEPGRFNKAWRRQGYDAIFDDKGIIHTAEVQLIVLNPRFVEVVRVEEQKGTGFDEVNKVLDLLASKYGALGEVTIRRPTQQKDWGEKQLRGSIEIRNGNNHATFTVSPWFVHKKDENIPETISVRLKFDSKNLTGKWSWGVDLKFRNFESELHRLTDPKEDVAKAMQQIFGEESVSALLPVTSPMGPDFADSSDAFIGPPFGGLDFETHPMRADPEMWQHAPSAPAQQFMKDLVPLLSAFAGTPTVDEKDGQIEVEIEGKGQATGYLHGADDLSWWFEKTPEEMDDFPFNTIAILEHVEISDPKLRRDGVGTELVKAFAKAAKNGGAQAIFLNASPFGAEAGGGRLTIGQITAFYRSLGFKTWQDQGNSQVMWLDLGKKTKSDFTREDTSGFYPEGWHDNKAKDPGRLAPDPWINTVPEAAHSVTITELFCDQDGVLSDFDQMFYDHSGKKTSEVESPELWKTIDRIGGFWTDMDWMPDGPELWEFLKPYNPTILSAPSRSPDCIPGKTQWLAQHIGEVPAIFEQAKEQYAGQGKVLIDDRESNIKKWREAGGIGILHTSAADTIRQLKELKEGAAVQAAALPTGFQDSVPEQDLVDAFNYAATSVGVDIFIEDDGESLEDKGFEFKQKSIKLKDPASLQDMSAFINKKQYPKGWLAKKPTGKWASLLEEAANRDFEIIVKSYLKNSLAPVITINGEFGDGRGRCLLMYSLGLKVPVADYSVSRDGHELITSATEAGARGDWESEGGYYFKVSRSDGMWSANVYHPDKKIGPEERQETIDHYMNDGMTQPQAEEQFEESYVSPHGGLVGFLQMNTEKIPESPHVKGFPSEPGQAYHVWVDEQYRRKGLASAMYRQFERDTGIKAIPSPTVTGPGRELWEGMKRTATVAVFTKKPGIGTYYHGTRSEIDRFTKPGNGKQGVGFYFTPTETEAWYFADSLLGEGNRGEPRVYEVSLKVKNPLNTMSVEDCEKVARHYGFVYRKPRFAGGASEHYQALEKQMVKHHMATKNDLNEKIAAVGFDGIYYEFMGHIIAFRPDQIKIKKVLTEYSQKPAAAAAPELTGRAEAKATIPQDSELMEFYNMADADAWAEDVREDSERDWEQMPEAERLKEIPDVISHTGWRHLSKNPTTPEEWEEIKSAWLGMRESYAMDNNNDTSETFFNNSKLVKNPTLVRFTDYPPPKGGKFLGHGPRRLGLTVHESTPGHGDLAFAFNVKELKTRNDWRSARSKYGEHIFKFKVPYAVEADHVSDGERQTIFDVNTVQDLKEIELPEATPTERIKEKIEEISNMQADDLMRAIDEYNETRRPSIRIGDALEKRRKELLKHIERRGKWLKTKEGQEWKKRQEAEDSEKIPF